MDQDRSHQIQQLRRSQDDRAMAVNVDRLTINRDMAPSSRKVSFVEEEDPTQTGAADSVPDLASHEESEPSDTNQERWPMNYIWGALLIAAIVAVVVASTACGKKAPRATVSTNNLSNPPPPPPPAVAAAAPAPSNASESILGDSDMESILSDLK